MNRSQVSVIVPAYNEAERIESVLKAINNAELVDNIVVVNDGSTDQTAEKVRENQAEVELINLDYNKGKATALSRGVDSAPTKTVMFLDADLIGLKPEHVDKMIQTYKQSELDMVIGVFHKGRLNTDLSQKISPHLSGQRILSVDLWNKLDESKAQEFGVEMALTKLSLAENLSTTKVKLTGVTHVMKEEKRGFTEGIKSRLKMYKNIIKTTFTPTGLNK